MEVYWETVEVWDKYRGFYLILKFPYRSIRLIIKNKILSVHQYKLDYNIYRYSFDSV